jgi:hypothetical protein
MKNDLMPEGFFATREGGKVKVHLPEMVVTQSHVYEPMLTRGAAQRVAEALWNADVESPIERVVLLRDARYSEETVEKFRERVWAVLVEGGVEAQIDIEIEPLADEPSMPEPTAEPAAPPAPAAPSPSPAAAGETPAGDRGAAPARKAFTAPVSSRKRLGGDRGARKPGAA